MEAVQVRLLLLPMGYCTCRSIVFLILDIRPRLKLTWTAIVLTGLLEMDRTRDDWHVNQGTYVTADPQL